MVARSESGALFHAEIRLGEAARTHTSRPLCLAACFSRYAGLNSLHQERAQALEGTVDWSRRASTPSKGEGACERATHRERSEAVLTNSEKSTTGQGTEGLQEEEEKAEDLPIVDCRGRFIHTSDLVGSFIHAGQAREKLPHN